MVGCPVENHSRQVVVSLESREDAVAEVDDSVVTLRSTMMTRPSFHFDFHWSLLGSVVVVPMYLMMVGSMHWVEMMQSMMGQRWDVVAAAVDVVGIDSFH